MLRTEQLEIDVRLHRLVLNREHVGQYSLPRTPMKESERRAATFEARHGEGCIELNALEALQPGALAGIVARALSHYYSADADAAARDKDRALRRAIRESVAEITAKYAEEIEALRAMNREVDALEIGGDFVPERPVPSQTTTLTAGGSGSI